MVMSLIKKAKDLGATAAEARQIAKELKNLNKKPTQDIFKKKFKQVLASRVDKDTGGSQKTADLVGTKGEKVTVAKDRNFLEMSKTKGSKERAKLITRLEEKETKGTITKEEQKKLNRMIAADEKVESDRKFKSGLTQKGKPKKEKDKFMSALKLATEDGELGADYESLLPNQKKKIEQAAIAFKKLKDKKQESPERDAKQLVRNRMRIPMNKGGLKMPTADQVGLKKLPTPVRNKMGYMYGGGMMKKPRMSSMDYRKGGLLILAIDMMKKKNKKGK